jgi:CHAT domain-containing protein
MSRPSAASLAQRLLAGEPATVHRDDTAAIAELLKAEADRQISIDSQRSLEIAELICALQADPAVRALGLLTRADALRQLGRYAEAAHAYQQAADLFRAVDDDVGWARTRSGAALVARYIGGHALVLEQLDQARGIFGQRGLWLRLTRLEQNAGGLLAALGRADDALAAHERALAAAERLDPRNELLEAEVWGNLSLAYYRVDDHERANAFLARAVAVFEREGQHEFVARAERNYARYAVARGHYSAALAAVLPGRRALLSLGRIAGAAHLGQVGVDCLLRLNRVAEAAELSERVAAEFANDGGQVEAASTLVQHGLALARLGDDVGALAALDRAATLFGTADWEAGPSVVQLGRAVVLGELGQWSRALDEAVAVRDELRRRGALARAAEAELVRARALRALGQSAAAQDVACDTLALIAERALPALSYQASRLLGELSQDAGDADGALSAYLQAITSLELVQGRILTEYRASFLADKVDVYQISVELLLDRGDVADAFDLVERAKSRALVDALAGGLDIRVRPRSDEQRRLVAELGQLRRVHDELVENGESGVQVVELERQIGTVLEELRLAGADDLEGLSLLEHRVHSPRAALDAQTALVQFFCAGADLLVFVVDRERIIARRVVGAVARVANGLRGLQLNLHAVASATPERRAALEPNARALLGRLYGDLVAPIADELRGYERLVMLPHGILHQVPFAALHDGHGYLVERYELVSAPSASSLSFCLRPRTRDTQRALVVAHSAAGVLPGAVDEARRVADLFPGECLLEEQATGARLRERAPQADLLHIATHGVSRLDAPLFSYLRLADGHLTAADCFELELDCALVTLSACESGRGVVDAGDEQIGLPRAFLYAGARSVVYSLWRIDDRATQSLMECLYGELRAGRGRGAALRAAQLASLRRAGSHPWWWAGLVLVGDWR